MYGWLLESVQHFIVEECGEEIWETILREAGAKNMTFNATQQYPDALMLRLASTLVRLVTQDSKSQSSSQFNNPDLASKEAFATRKPSWRSNTVHTDGRTNYRCPFTASISALTAATKKEIENFNSLDDVRSTSSQALQKKGDIKIENPKPDFNRRSSCNKLENKADALEKPVADKPKDEKKNPVKETDPLPSTSSVESNKTQSILKKTKQRKNSVTLAVDVYRRRGSGNPTRQRQNSLSHISEDKLNTLREKFGTTEKVMHFFGRCFVKFFSNYGYDTMIRATGRYFCTFLQSVDSIHQRMRFTFPRMRSPSMQLTRAHRLGAELVYRTTRIGFTHYLMGQLYEIAEDIFSLKLNVSIVKESMENNYYEAVLRLEFDNNDYVQSLMNRKSIKCPLPPVPVSLFLQLFPFGVLLDRKMRIIQAGPKLMEAWGGPYKRIQKQPVTDILRLQKPHLNSLTWDKVTCMQTMSFELELIRFHTKTPADARRGSQGTKAVLLKGPMYLLEETDALIFLCSPVFNNLDELQQADLYLADLNFHGLSKEMLLEGWQHLSRLDFLFEKAENKSMSLEKSYRLRDQWKNKGDQLLYSMIPKSIAYHLRAGKGAERGAWQHYDSVTVMFCGLQLAEAGSRADVMETVDFINDVYSRIDRLLDGHRVYKVMHCMNYEVETVGTVYMLVSGVPERCRAHAESAASAALAIARSLPMLTIGVHSGSCMAGVLSSKLPRFCLVGDTVNTASRMQTTCEPGKIQVSSQTKSLLPPKFRLRRRGPIEIKGKGKMETYWLEAELEEDDQDEALQLFSALCGEVEE